LGSSHPPTPPFFLIDVCPAYQRGIEVVSNRMVPEERRKLGAARNLRKQRVNFHPLEPYRTWRLEPARFNLNLTSFTNEKVDAGSERGTYNAVDPKTPISGRTGQGSLMTTPRLPKEIFREPRRSRTGGSAYLFPMTEGHTGPRARF